MFCNQLKKDLATTQALLQQKNEILTAIHRSMAVIEFDLTSKILTANENFLATMGYSLSEIQGQHHRMFVTPEYAQSAEYAQFWATLASGKFFSASYQRFGKGGKEIWIEATYNPIFDASGKPYKVIKFASDITERVKASNEAKCKLEAIDRSMAAIEFDLTGKILTANENFLATLGYSLSEIQGQHHRMFVTPEYAQSAEYAQFWATLAAGKYFTGTYKRVGKGGKEVWIEASYNPIFDTNGKPYKVIKFATDAANKQKLLSIKLVSEVLSETAHGNLTRRMEGNFDGEIRQLQTSINTTLDKLNEVVRTVSASACVVNDISAQLTQNAADLSSRIQEQAASLGQTSSTMHQMTSSVQSSTDNAQKVAELTRQVQQQSSDGVKVMNDTIGAMKSIQEASNKIADIVSLIDSIAFQTNLLALNAAVEAARAGEHGRGFAVVASEVRALAGKSADAAKDIKNLINDSVARIHAGTQLADKSGEMLNGISHSVSQVASMIEQIANASKEQSAGIQQLGQAITSIDRMTQENAALVEETTATSATLSSEADHLRENVAFFNTGTNAREATRAHPAVSSAARPSAKKPAALPHAPKKHSSEEWDEF